MPFIFSFWGKISLLLIINIFYPSLRIKLLLFEDLLSIACWFLFFFFYYLLLLFFTLQCCICFATHQHESATGVHMFPILNPLSHLPPHTIPLVPGLLHSCHPGGVFSMDWWVKSFISCLSCLFLCGIYPGFVEVYFRITN